MSAQWEIAEGDSLEVLRTLRPECIDAMVTDPPAGIEFMGKDWDTFRGDSRQPGVDNFPVSNSGPHRRAKVRHGTTAGYKNNGAREGFIGSLTPIFVECLRVLKPGAHGLVWAIPRTSHWTASALEDAGFEIRDVITHHFGTGFPKSLDVSKAIDKAGGVSPVDQAKVLRAKRDAAGMSREQLATLVGCTEASIRDWEEGRARREGGPLEHMVPSETYRAKLADVLGYTTDERRILGSSADRRGDGSVVGIGHSGVLRDGGNTAAAKQWDGWGTALKPASEHWILVRKPLIDTVAENVQAHGTGALNIDGCRIHSGPSTGGSSSGASALGQGSGWNAHESRTTEIDRSMAAGRWPANLVLSHSPDCESVGTRTVPANGAIAAHTPSASRETSTNAVYAPLGGHTWQPYGNGDGTETIEACPVAELDAQSGELKAGAFPGSRGKGSERARASGHSGQTNLVARRTDGGGASRFFYTAKPSKRERGEGNNHPTVKPVALMRYLCRLVTPPGGLVLDPFAGSGTTGIAALAEGFSFLGIEREAAYADIARSRLTAGLPA